MASDRIQLTPITPDTLLLPEVQQSESLGEVCRATILMYGATGGVKPWTGYLARSEGEIVGTCAFKGEPGGGRVEIAYHTFPGHEGRGIATAMAGELVRLAEAAGIREIAAHTRPERNASTRVLEKLGFLCEGVVEHPEDGVVWEWRYRMPSMGRERQRKLHWAGLFLTLVGFVLLTIGGEISWPALGLVVMLLFNSGVLGLTRDRFSPKTHVVLGWLAAAVGLTILVAGLIGLVAAVSSLASS